MRAARWCLLFFFFNDTATTEIYTLSLHDALPIWAGRLAESLIALGKGFVQQHAAGGHAVQQCRPQRAPQIVGHDHGAELPARSEEHTSELQSQSNLVCRLLLEKKKKQTQASSGHS